MNETNTQVTMFGVLDQSISRVFRGMEIKDKNGAVVGGYMAPKTRKEMAEALDLKGKSNKDALDLAMLKESDLALVKVKQHLAGLNGEHTLHKFKFRTLANGTERMSIEVDKVSRSKRMSDEKLAEGMFPAEMYPAMTLEDKLAAIVELRASQEAQLGSKSIES